MWYMEEYDVWGNEVATEKVLPYSWFWSHIGFWRQEKAEALHTACSEILLSHIHIPH